MATTNDCHEIYDRVEKQLIATGFKTDSVHDAIIANNLYLLSRRSRLELQLCQGCKMHCQHKVPGVGTMDSPIMIIGESPGKDELATGAPFMGAAGTALVIMLNALGVYRGRVYMTNATHCNTFGPDGKFITPDREEIEACRHHLINEIRIGQPKVILAVGKPALWAVTGNYSTKISQVRGTIADLDEKTFGVKAKVVFTWHPSYLIRKGGTPEFEQIKNDMWRDINLAFDMARKIAPLYNFNKRPVI